MAEIVVADAGPLIALGRLQKIELLRAVFEKVIVPEIVFEEIQGCPDFLDAIAIREAYQSGIFDLERIPADTSILPPGSDLALENPRLSALRLSWDTRF